MKKTATALTLALAALTTQAQAATFLFTFDIAGSAYMGGGSFEGDLQPDGDTILNMSNLMVSYTDGTDSYANTANPLFFSGFWSLSAAEGFWTTAAPVPGGMAVDDLTSGGFVAFGDPAIAYFAYEPTDFSISAAPIPLPASLGLLLAGLGALGWAGRRRPR